MRTDAAEWHAMAQHHRVLNDVRMHYFRARGRQEIRDTQIELLKNAEDFLLTTRERYNVGQAILADVHQANAALQRQRLSVLMAENDYQQSFEELQALVGVDLPCRPLETSLQGDLTPLEREQILDRLLNESPQIQEALAKLAADRITIRREVVEPIPDIVIEAGSGYNFEARDTVAMVQASIEVPLFDRNQGTIRQAEADYARQQGEVRRIELMLRRDLANQYRTYLTALQHVRDYQQVVLPENRRAYELLLESYEAHRAPWIDVLNAEETYFQARVQYIQNLMAWREAEVLLLGYLLHGGLQAPTQPVPPGHIDAVPRPR
jgi:outer membrane protein, heavy metal efflux system